MDSGHGIDRVSCLHLHGLGEEEVDLVGEHDDDQHHAGEALHHREHRGVELGLVQLAVHAVVHIPGIGTFVTF